jgi:hypothetical protein
VVPASQLLQHDGFIDETAASFSVRPGHVSEALSRVLDREVWETSAVRMNLRAVQWNWLSFSFIQLLVYPQCIVSE